VCVQHRGQQARVTCDGQRPASGPAGSPVVVAVGVPLPLWPDARVAVTSGAECRPGAGAALAGGEDEPAPVIRVLSGELSDVLAADRAFVGLDDCGPAARLPSDGQQLTAGELAAVVGVAQAAGELVGRL